MLLLHSWTGRIQTVAEDWLSGVPEAEVTEVTFTSSSFRIDVRVPPGELPPTDELLEQLDGEVPDGLTSSSTRPTARRSTWERPGRPEARNAAWTRGVSPRALWALLMVSTR